MQIAAMERIIKYICCVTMMDKLKTIEDMQLDIQMQQKKEYEMIHSNQRTVIALLKRSNDTAVDTGKNKRSCMFQQTRTSIQTLDKLFEKIQSHTHDTYDIIISLKQILVSIFDVMPSPPEAFLTDKTHNIPSFDMCPYCCQGTCILIIYLDYQFNIYFYTQQYSM